MRAQIAVAAALGATLGIAGMPGEARAEYEEPERSGRFLPTLSAAAGRQAEDVVGHGWLGAAYLPSDEALTWFFAAGGEIDVRPYHPGEGEAFTTVVFGPQARFGVAWFPDANMYLSAINVYALTGYRAPSAFNNGAFRVGLGASSPLAGVAALGAKLVIPWMVEGSLDVVPGGYELAWRIGVAY